MPAEVKCNWNREVATALRDQLGRRYLQGPEGTAGVYVAVCIGGSSWHSSDSRRAQAARRPLEGLRDTLRGHADDPAARASPPTSA